LNTMTENAGIVHYWHILRRRWMLVGIFFVIAVFAGTALGRFLTPIYRASATVIVDTSARDLMGVDASTSSKTYFERSTELATRAELARSRRVLAEAVRILGWNRDSAHPDPVQRLEKGLSVSIKAGTQFIVLSYESPEREQVHVAANAIARAFEGQSLLALTGASASAANWLGGQLPELREKVIDAEKRRYEFQQKHNILTTDRSLDAASKRFAQLTGDLARIERERISIETQVAMIDKTDPESVDSLPFVAENSLVRELSDLRRKLRSQRTDLLSRYQPDHGKVKVLDGQMAQLAEEEAQARNRILKAVRERLEYVRLEEEKLKAACARQEVAVMDLNRKRLDLEALDREVAWAREIYEPLASRRSKLFLASGNETPPVKIWDKARMPEYPVRPRQLLIVLVAAMLGLMVGAQLAILVEGSDTSVRTPAELGEAAHLNVAGTIPHVREAEARKRALVCQLSPRSPAAEAFRALRTSVLFHGNGNIPRSVLVTGSVEDEGKTLVSINLATALAQMDKKVLLIDADLQRSAVHKALGLPNRLGLSDVLTGKAKPDAAVAETNAPGLSAMVAGASPENPAELLHSPAIKETLEWAIKTFDAVVLDSPPLASVTDASLLACHVEGVILVSRAQKTRKGMVARSGRALAEARANVIGAVLNDIPRSSRGYGHSYDYGYGYGYGYSAKEKSSEATDG